MGRLGSCQHSTAVWTARQIAATNAHANGRAFVVSAADALVWIRSNELVGESSQSVRQAHMAEQYTPGGFDGRY